MVNNDAALLYGYVSAVGVIILLLIIILVKQYCIGASRVCALSGIEQLIALNQEGVRTR